MTTDHGNDSRQGPGAASGAALNVVDFSSARLARRWQEVDEAITRLAQEIAADSRIRLPARQALAVEMAELRSALTRGPDPQAHASIEMVSLVTLIRGVDYRLIKGIATMEGAPTPSLRSAVRQFLESTQTLVNAYRRGAEHSRNALNWIVREHEPLLERLVTGGTGQLTLEPGADPDSLPRDD